MRILPCCVALTILVTPLHVQALEDKITDLFIFGEGEQALFLGGSGGSDDPTISRAARPSAPRSPPARSTPRMR
jgi:hypothetical protein